MQQDLESTYLEAAAELGTERSITHLVQDLVNGRFAAAPTSRTTDTVDTAPEAYKASACIDSPTIGTTRNNVEDLTSILMKSSSENDTTMNMDNDGSSDIEEYASNSDQGSWTCSECSTFNYIWHSNCYWCAVSATPKASLDDDVDTDAISDLWRLGWRQNQPGDPGWPCLQIADTGTFRTQAELDLIAEMSLPAGIDDFLWNKHSVLHAYAAHGRRPMPLAQLKESYSKHYDTSAQASVFSMRMMSA